MKGKPLSRLFAALLLMILLFACAVPSSAEDGGRYAGKKIGILMGSIHDKIIRECYPEAEQYYFSSISDEAVALASGTLDYFTSDILSARSLTREDPRFTFINDGLAYVPTAFACSKNERGAALCAQIDEFMNGIDESGELKALQDKWLSEDSGDYAVDLSDLDGANGTLVFATTASGRPNSYYYEGAPTGYEVELAAMFCRACGYAMDIQVTDFAGIIPGLVSGKYDFAADRIAVTEERAESVNFSVPDFYNAVVMIARNEEATGAAHGLRQKIGASFERTFIRESRWKLIVQGILTTLIIAAGASALGTLLGFGLCLLRRLNSKAVRAVTGVYIRLMQGTPILVLLMILYYIIFAKAGIPGELVAIFAFALNFAAYAAEIFRSGIESVDIGQTEAALAIGYTKPQAFFCIILPQAARSFLPVYKGEFISLVKMTSVVGYIAVQDLTKMSDIIRSRTYEAFFPLIATAVIYFALSALLTGLLKLIELRIEPDRAHRRIKGVKLQ